MAAQFAVVATGGKQYVVEVGKRYRFEKLAGDPGASIRLDHVLLTFAQDSTDVRVGTPTLAGVAVEGRVVRQARTRKLRVVKYRAKSRYRRVHGHRQHFTEVEITGIA